MTNLTVFDREGERHEITPGPGLTLMEAIRKSDIYELVAMCGGCCSCATCHVFVEQGPDSLADPAREDEDDLLDSSDHRQENSRLSCQVELDAVEGDLVVRIAPED